MYRFAFNRFKDDIVATQVYRILAKTFEDVNCHLRNSAMRKANGLFTLTKNKDNKIHFGKFLKFKRGLITKEELRNSKDIGILSEGEFNQKGNRLFEIDVENNKFIYKRNRKEHYDLVIVEKLNDKRQCLLSKL